MNNYFQLYIKLWFYSVKKQWMCAELNRETRMDFSLPLENKINNISTKQSFSRPWILGNKDQRFQGNGIQKTWISTIAPVYYLERASRLQPRGNSEGPGRLPDLRRESWGFGAAHGGYCLEEKVSHSVVSDSLQPHGLQPSRLLCPRDFPDKNTGVGCHFLLQGSSRPRGWKHIFFISCIGRQIPYHCTLWRKAWHLFQWPSG